MVLALDPEAVAALEQSNEAEWVVSAFYGDQTTIPSDKYPGIDRVPLTGDGSLTFDAGGQIQANGTVYLARDGASLVPASFTDPLAPYGQELAVVRRVTYAGASWDIPLGRFRIQDVPDMSTLYGSWPGVTAQLGWSAQLSVCDRFDILQADDFLATTTPTAGNTTWDEIRALCTIPVVESLPDAAVPSGIVYQGRVDGLTQLASNLGGEPAITREGAFTVRLRNAWLTETVPAATVTGTVDVSKGMSNNLINSVVATNPNNALILAVAEITDESNPLAITRPIGRRTQQLSNPLWDTQAKAQAGAQTALARLSTQQSKTVKVSCLPRPDIDLGDFIQVTDARTGEKYLGEVRNMGYSFNPTDLMTMELTVAEVI